MLYTVSAQFLLAKIRNLFVCLFVLLFVNANALMPTDTLPSGIFSNADSVREAISVIILVNHSMSREDWGASETQELVKTMVCVWSIRIGIRREIHQVPKQFSHLLIITIWYMNSAHTKQSTYSWETFDTNFLPSSILVYSSSSVYCVFKFLILSLYY